jgi:GxxExxY protein
LANKGLEVENQKRIGIYYKGEKIGSYVPDFIINGVVLVEVKCKPYLVKEDLRQFWLYLKGSDYSVGLLVNFGSEKLDIRRRVYDRSRFPRKSA